MGGDRPGAEACDRQRPDQTFRQPRPDKRRRDASLFAFGRLGATRPKQPESRANVWAFDYALDLYSNFTYCAVDIATTGNCDNGDQFKQKDRRQAGGFDASHTVYDRWAGFEVENTFGADGRRDRIHPVGLYSTTARQVTAVTREDEVDQRSLAVYVQNLTYWLPWLRTQAGLRADHYRFDVNSNVPENSGKRSDQMISPKFTAIFGPWGAQSPVRFYANWGRASIAMTRAAARSPSTGDAAQGRC